MNNPFNKSECSLIWWGMFLWAISHGMDWNTVTNPRTSLATNVLTS